MTPVKVWQLTILTPHETDKELELKSHMLKSIYDIDRYKKKILKVYHWIQISNIQILSI